MLHQMGLAALKVNKLQVYLYHEGLCFSCLKC